MEYTNENFEKFQQSIARSFDEGSLLWLLRDAIFVEAFYGKHSQKDIHTHLPYGDFFAYKYLQFQARKADSVSDTIDLTQNASHFLFVSSRNNHINRLIPLLQEAQQTGQNCIAWVSDPSVIDMIPSELKFCIREITHCWTKYTKKKDLVLARKLSADLTRALPRQFTRRQRKDITVYLVQFFAWERFWKEAFQSAPTSLATTFEKSAIAKAFFYAGYKENVSTRIHWLHGLRHASLQATLSTKLWCMTPGDVRFFEDRVPDFCTPSVKQNPEAQELATAIGVLDPSSLCVDDPIHFLFLGPGLESSYNREMRMADLSIIRKIQQKARSNISWRFRPHPSATERFRSELNEANIDIQDFSTRHLHDDLKWAHAVGSSWSSLLLDIRETGRPIFWVQAEIRSLGAVNELIEDGIGFHLTCENCSKLLEYITGEKAKA